MITTLLVIPWIRSHYRDETLTWERTEVTSDLLEINIDWEIGWGPHGLRFWRWYDRKPQFCLSCLLEECRVCHHKKPDFRQNLTWHSENYVNGESWGWQIESTWNRFGFWWHSQDFSWGNEHHRRISLVAVPFWLPVGLCLAITGVLIAYSMRQRRVTEQDGGGNALEPPSHSSTTPPKSRATP